MAARRRKVHSTPFPPGGENCVRSLAPPLPGEPASLGFAGSNEGLGKTPPGTAPDEHFVLIVAHPTPSGPSGHLPLTGGVGPGPRYGGRITESFSKISGAQNLSGLCDSSRATSSSRISYPSLRPAGQSSLTPSLLLSNANPLRWALRWGPPAAAYLGGKLRLVRFQSRAWLCRAGGGRSVVGGPVWDRPLQKGRTPLHML